MKSILLNIFWLLFTQFCVAFLPAQTIKMEFINLQKKETNLPIKRSKVVDSLLIQPKIDQSIQLLMSRGFWDASFNRVDSNNRVYVYLNPGFKYTWTSMSYEGLPKNLASAKSIENDQWFKQEINPEIHFKRILREFENSGYPFASLRFEDVKVDSNKLQAKVNVDMGPKILVDSIKVIGNVKIAPAYLHAYLGIKPQKEFNAQRFRNADRLLRDLPFMEIIRPTETLLSPEHARLHIYARKVNTSYFSGILGFQPGSGIGGKLRLTGDLQLKLWNVLERGEQIDLEWKRIANGTQNAQVYLMYPYILGTPLAVWGKFSLFRRDTSFQTIEYGAGLDYLWYGTNKIRFGYMRQSSRLIERGAYILSQTLPPDMDLDWDKLNVEVDFARYDYRLNPTKGYRIHLQLQPGIRKIRPISELNDTLYQSFSLRTFQLYSGLNWEQFVRLRSKMTFYYQTQFAYQYSPARFYNELLRIGGNQSLRGFDEQSIYTNGYALLNMELRFLFEKNSNVFVFANGAFAEQALQRLYQAHWYYGFGAGIRFGTKAGILNLTYGLGSRNEEPIKFSNSKIHLGFTGVF